MPILLLCFYTILKKYIINFYFFKYLLFDFICDSFVLKQQCCPGRADLTVYVSG